MSITARFVAPLKPLLLGLALGAGLFGCAPSKAAPPDALEAVKARGELVVGTDATYPPFENKVGDTYTGFDLDLVRAMAKRMGVKARFVNASFDGVFPALLSGKYDAVISAVTITPERARQMRFTAPYYNAGQQIATRWDGAVLETPEALDGKTVGIQINTTAQVVLEKREGVSIRKYNTIDLALLDLQNRKLEAVVSDGPTLRAMLAQSYPGLVVRGEPFTSEYYGIALKPDAKRLQGALNEALAAVIASGEYAELEKRYFGAVSGTVLPAVAPAAEEAERERDAQAARAPSGGLRLDPGLVWRMGPVFLQGVALTLGLALAGLVGGVPIGLALALARLSSAKPLRALAAIYVEAVRGTPLLVQIFFLYFILPAFGVSLPELVTAVLALALNAGAYVAEIFRSAIAAVPPGQLEAARALGMSYPLAMREVVLPQAFFRAIPPLTNEGVALLKDSSLVSIMGMTELTRTGQELASRYADPVTIWLAVAALYLVLTLPLTQLAGLLERRLAAGSRR